MERVSELAEFFESLAAAIPEHGDPTEPWQGDVIEAVGECFDSRSDQLAPLLLGRVRISSVGRFKRALRTLHEKVGRYSSAGNAEIHKALLLVASTLRETAPVVEARTGSPSRLADDIAQLEKHLLARAREDSGTAMPTFNSESLAAVLGWSPPRFNRAMNVLAKRRLIELDPTCGSVPFDARGFELTEDGILAFEAAHLDALPDSSKDSPVLQPPRTETRSILFMDLAGWSKLRAPQLSAYLERALPKLDVLVKGYGAQHINTWGDALVATFGSSKEAAECALDVRDFFRRTPETEGVPSGLIPRIALHVGEVIIAHNPLLARTDVFGDAVHLAARLEPVTGTGEVYCTAEFGTALDAIRGMGPCAHPIGEVELPKAFGLVRVFAVTWPNEPSPAPKGRTA